MKMPDARTFATLAAVGAGGAAAVLGAHFLKRDRVGPVPMAFVATGGLLATALAAGGKFRKPMLLAAGGAFALGLAQEVAKRFTIPAQVAASPYALGALPSGAVAYSLPPGQSYQTAQAGMYDAAQVW